MPLVSMKDLLLFALKDLHSAETQLARTLPAMVVSGVRSQGRKDTFQQHTPIVSCCWTRTLRRGRFAVASSHCRSKPRSLFPVPRSRFLSCLAQFTSRSTLTTRHAP